MKSAIFSNVWLAPLHKLHPSGSSIKGKSAHESYHTRVCVVFGLEIPYAIEDAYLYDLACKFRTKILCFQEKLEMLQWLDGASSILCLLNIKNNP
jgi:hypothetical protein